jgi:hypothetical protein
VGAAARRASWCAGRRFAGGVRGQWGLAAGRRCDVLQRRASGDNRGGGMAAELLVTARAHARGPEDSRALGTSFAVPKPRSEAMLAELTCTARSSHRRGHVMVSSHTVPHMHPIRSPRHRTSPAVRYATDMCSMANASPLRTAQPTYLIHAAQATPQRRLPRWKPPPSTGYLPPVKCPPTHPPQPISDFGLASPHLASLCHSTIQKKEDAPCRWL